MCYPTVKKAYYDTPDGQIHYRYLQAAVKDESKAPILLFHMCPTSSLYFEELIQRCAAAGYDTYAPDMPGFGASYNPITQPSGIKYYVEVFMLLAKHVGITKFHTLGHHSGASISTEMAVLYPESILSICLCAPALLTAEEQAKFRDEELVMFNKPAADGSHLKINWDKVSSQPEPWDTLMLHGQVLDCSRAYEGRIQIYTCVFTQPMGELLAKVECPVMGMAADNDMLVSYLPRVTAVKPDAKTAIVKGGDFEVLKDAEGVCRELIKFIEGI